jgi:hypothetical protein
LTLSTAQTTAPTCGRLSFRTRLAIHQASSEASEIATIASPRPTPWSRSMSAEARLKKMTGGSST